MENVVVFAVAFVLLLSLSVISLAAMISYMTAFTQSLKGFSERHEAVNVFDTDKIYITGEVNGSIWVRNRTATELLDVRLFCWEKNNVDTNALIEAEYMGSIVRSIRYLSFFSGYNEAEYNLVSSGIPQAALDSNNVICAIITRNSIRVFEVLG